MQKVSKQSLAMIALSILLAISIALTFTFAAASGNKTAKGSITFSGNVTVAYDGSTDSTEGTITIGAATYNGASSSFAMDTNTNKFTVTSSGNLFVKITVTVTDATVTVALPTSLTVGDVSLAGGETSITAGETATFKNTAAITGASSGLDILVKNIISSISFDANGTMKDGSITIKVEAQSNAAY